WACCGASAAWRSTFQYFDECLLRNVHAAEGFHALFAFLLLFEQFALAADVAAITFRSDVLAHGADAFPGDDLSADGRLDGNLILLARDDLLQLRCEGASPALRLVAVDDAGKGIHGFGIHQHVELDHVALHIIGMFVIHGTVTAGHAFDAI